MALAVKLLQHEVLAARVALPAHSLLFLGLLLVLLLLMLALPRQGQSHCCSLKDLRQRTRLFHFRWAAAAACTAAATAVEECCQCSQAMQRFGLLLLLASCWQHHLTTLLPSFWARCWLS
jgi:hypothetical protein